MDITIKLDGVQEGEKYTLEVCVKKGKTRVSSSESISVKKSNHKTDDLSLEKQAEDELAILNNSYNNTHKIESNINI
jgi:hypothetical protein